MRSDFINERAASVGARCVDRKAKSLGLCSFIAILIFSPVLKLQGATGVSSFVDPTAQHFLFVDQNQHLQILYTGSSFPVTDLTNAAQSPIVAVDSGIGSFIESNGAQHFVFIDSNQHVQQIFWWQSQWGSTDLTSAANAPLAAPQNGVAAFVDPGGGQHFLFVDSNQHLRQILYTGSFAVGDLTQAAGAPAVGAGGGLSAFVDPTGAQHFLFVDQNQHIQQILYTGSFAVGDLTSASGAPAVGAGDGISSFVEPGGVQHFLFVNSSQHLIQILYAGGFAVGDLTSASGASVVATGGGISTFLDPAQAQHFVFVDSNQHLVQIFWYNNSWGGSDLTSASGAPAPASQVIVSGQVLAGSSGLAGATVTLSGTTAIGTTMSLTTTTDSNGSYSFSVPAGGTYTAVPFLSGYTFSPASTVFNEVSTNQTANSSASPQTGTLSQSCSDITGTWTDGNYTYSLLETLGTVTGTDTLILPYGRVVWALSGQTTDGANYSMRVYNPTPTTTDFGVPDQEDDFTLTAISHQRCRREPSFMA